MITYRQGNLLDATSGVIIHGCNAKGVMGSGVALAVKNKYPEVYDMYKRTEQDTGLNLCSLQICRINKNLQVVNAITQESYGRDSSIRYVSYGAIHLAFERLHMFIPIDIPFHFPKIGAGLGNGSWEVIYKLIELACPDRELICWEL